MTDTSLSVKAINAPDLSHASLSAAYPPARHQHYHAPAQLDVPEDDGQISCICGYADDDGWTVACDSCNKWQHQSCYYPHYDERSLPEEVQHYCVQCKPRHVDVHRARQRQQEKRKQPEPSTNGLKRTMSKSHKKKIKEPAGVYTNGLHDKVRHDRNSASPRDQPPPAKRPKTTHRTSDSTTTATIKGHSRKRNASTANHRRSLSRSPDLLVEQYSEEFLQCCIEDDWQVTDSNLHNSIAVRSALSEWLNAPEDEFRQMHNQAKGEVLMRWDGQLEDIPGKAQIELLQNRDDSVQYQGQHPTWKTVTLKETVASGAYIGELKGHVGFKKEYQHDTANRWAQLRHPEPFVFFHPKLPIVIDARHEGTELRYVRRSCMPNARLQVLVTDGVDYHFCFMATQQIEPGDEVAVGWDTGDGLPELASRSNYSVEELETLSGWVSTALANCGPCACQMPEKECKMFRFDRRILGAREDAQPSKSLKAKKRKAGQHVSPINTHALNSRSGSEAHKGELEDDGTDTRSTSGSAGRGSASRDMTPNTHYSSNGLHSAATELSERERKKLAKEEEIFRRQEEEQAGKQAKKKRNSAGSALSTPSATSSKQLGFPPNNLPRYVDAGTVRQSGLPAKAIVGRNSKASSKPPSRLSSGGVERPKPAYSDSGTQCDMDREDLAQTSTPSTPRRPCLSIMQRLLDLCARNNAAVLSHQSTRSFQSPQNSSRGLDEMEVDQPTPQKPCPSRSPVPGPVPNIPQTVSQPIEEQKDIDMADAPSREDRQSGSSPLNQEKALPKSGSLLDTGKPWPALHSPSHPPPPASAMPTDSDSGISKQRSPGMHIQMPPASFNSFGLPQVTPLTATPGMVSTSVAQSPGPNAPAALLSPAVTALTTPTGIQTKKMSLSDWTRTRRKPKDKDVEAKTDRESSPASVASGPVAPLLQPSSSAEVKAVEGSAIDEDVKMEEAGE